MLFIIIIPKTYLIISITIKNKGDQKLFTKIFNLTTKFTKTSLKEKLIITKYFTIT